ncbi:MAG: hypothetical protein R3C59_28975 [Planctomycetaceae bacterium]
MLRQQQYARLTCHALSLSFRAAFVTTLDLLLAETQPRPEARTAGKGFLERLPLLDGCAPQIQMDCLLDTWQRVKCDEADTLTDLDLCVCYCATAELAHLAELDDSRRMERVLRGPGVEGPVDTLWLASKLRTLQITWPFDRDCGVVLRDGNFLATDLDRVSEMSLHAETAAQMLDLAGHWFVTPRLLQNANGLVTDAEHRHLARVFQNHPSLMNL